MDAKVIVVLIGLVTLAACNRPGCDGTAYEAHPNAPVVTNMELVGQLTDLGDPWTLVFGVEFTDSNGDVGNGNANFYLNGSSTATSLPLSDDFDHSNLATSATSGRIAIPLRFNESIGDGSTVRLGLQLVDSANLTSNCYSLDLRFNVTPLTLAPFMRRWMLAARVLDLLGTQS